MSRNETLTQRAARARGMLRDCELCEHRCRVDRVSGKRGFCQADASARVWRYWVDYAEERALSPSLLIYLSGCDLRCDYCISESNAFDVDQGVRLTADWLGRRLDWGIEQGARTVQWIGGEPTIHAAAILEALSGCRKSLPIVWKSDVFGTPETWQLLDSVVDLYVADFKFGNEGCAERIAGVRRYVEIITRNLMDIASRAPLIVRHLLLPGHEACCLVPILGWLQRRLPHVPLSLRDGYLPRWRAGRHRELGRPLTPQEGLRARALAADFGLNTVD